MKKKEFAWYDRKMNQIYLFNLNLHMIFTVLIIGRDENKMTEHYAFLGEL